MIDVKKELDMITLRLILDNQEDQIIYLREVEILQIAKRIKAGEKNFTVVIPKEED